MDDFELLDHYQVLGVPRDATPREIDQAYRETMLREHPDRSDHPRASVRASRVNEAGRVLLDPEQRRQYDPDADTRRRREASGLQHPLEEDPLKAGVFVDEGQPALAQVRPDSGDRYTRVVQGVSESGVQSAGPDANGRSRRRVLLSLVAATAIAAVVGVVLTALLVIMDDPDVSTPSGASRDEVAYAQVVEDQPTQSTAEQEDEDAEAETESSAALEQQDAEETASESGSESGSNVSPRKQTASDNDRQSQRPSTAQARASAVAEAEIERAESDAGSSLVQRAGNSNVSANDNQPTITEASPAQRQSRSEVVSTGGLEEDDGDSMMGDDSGGMTEDVGEEAFEDVGEDMLGDDSEKAPNDDDGGTLGEDSTVSFDDHDDGMVDASDDASMGDDSDSMMGEDGPSLSDLSSLSGIAVYTGPPTTALELLMLFRDRPVLISLWKGSEWVQLGLPGTMGIEVMENDIIDIVTSGP